MGAFIEASRRLRDPSRVMRRASRFALGEIERGFREEEDPDGRPWPENAPATLAKKIGPSILTEEYDLRESMTEEFPAANVAIVGPSTSSPSYPYQKLQQHGGRNPQGRFVPARRYVGASRRIGAELSRLAVAHFRGELTR